MEFSGIFQTRTLEWAAISYSGDLPDSETELESSVSAALAGGFFTTAPPFTLLMIIIAMEVK